MRRLSGSAYTLIVVMAAMPAFIVLSMRMEYYASKFLPILVGSIVFVLAAIALARDISAARSPEKTATADKISAKEGAIKYLYVAAWIIGFAIAIYLVGFMIAIPFFVGAYMKRHGSGWLTTVITAIIFTGIIHAVFNFALKADLYTGILFRWLGF